MSPRKPSTSGLCDTPRAEQESIVRLLGKRLLRLHGDTGLTVVDVGDAGGDNEALGVGEQPGGVRERVAPHRLRNPQRRVAKTLDPLGGVGGRRGRQPIGEEPDPGCTEFHASSLPAEEVASPTFRDGPDAFFGVFGGAQPLLFGQFVIRRRGHGFGRDLAGRSRARRRWQAVRSPRSRRPRPVPLRGHRRDRQAGRRGQVPRPVRRESVGPSRTSCLAACWPIRRGSVTVSPKPGWMPSLAKLAANRACGAATRKSAVNAKPKPPPMAAPCTAATTGFFAPNSRTPSRYNKPVVFLNPSSVNSALPDASSWPVPKLAPAQNDLPFDANTMARQSRFSSKSLYASAICAMRSRSKKLCGGRSISTVAT